jgi:hypothetical protein
VKPRSFKLLVLLLPLFIARSMLPIGFMLSFDDGAARIVFCPSQTTLPNLAGVDAAAAAPTHHGHEHHHAQGDAGADSTEHSTQSCPFAFAAAAPPASVHAFAPEPAPTDAIAGPRDRLIVLVASRAHPIRGPPVLS